METARNIADMRMVGGHACLDFVNTVDSRSERWGPDLLRTYPDLVSWAVRADLVDANEESELLTKASRKPVAGEAALDGAKTLREALYAVLHAETTGSLVPSGDRQTVCDTVAQALSKRSLTWEGHRFAWCWTDGGDLDAISHRVAFAAAEFLVKKADRRTVRECMGPNCGWLFLDTSRGGRRRWCSDETCGTHSRIRRFRSKRPVR